MSEQLNFRIIPEGKKYMDQLVSDLNRRVSSNLFTLMNKSTLLSDCSQQTLIDYCQTIQALIKKIQCEIDFKLLTSLKDDVDVLILSELKDLPQTLNRYQMRYVLNKSLKQLETFHNTFYRKTDDKGVYFIADGENTTEAIHKNIFVARLTNLKCFAEHQIERLQNIDSAGKIEQLLKNYLKDCITLYYYCFGVLCDLENNSSSRNIKRDIDYINGLVDNISRLEYDPGYSDFDELSQKLKSQVLGIHNCIIESGVVLDDKYE
jgi:hypothetical protein